jgi:hypothetical protein
VSADGPSPGERLRSLRPWFLVAAMIFTWLAGVQGVTTGCATIVFLRQGSLPDESTAIEEAQAAIAADQGVVNTSLVIDDLAEMYNLRAVAEHGRAMMPLSIARVLLSILLVAASAMVLSGRRSARSFALQVFAANAVFALVAHAVTHDMREQWIAAVVRGTSALSLPRDHQLLTSPSYWAWGSRIQLVVFELGVLGMAAVAIQAKRTRTFLEASARAGERREREDEP